MVPLLENPLEPGTVIDRYRIVSRLAVGGMAELYLADAHGIEGFEKRLVLKRIHPMHLNKPDFVGMFLDEARIAATLQHPNIAQVYDIGCDGEIYFFTMEYVDGRDVRHIYNRVHRRGNKVPLEHTLNICVGALAGLHAAHEKRGPDGIPLGIVHRDVSPSNVIVTWDGNIKLIDFGIAKAARRQTMTRNGAVKGKHCSMSPEQACGRPIDRRSDIFSLGIMLWEMSVGETLFVAENEYEVMRRIVDGEVDRPSDRVSKYPPELEAIVMKALAHRVEDRYQTAEEMLIAIDSFARTNQLVIAPYALARYLDELFSERAQRDSMNGAVSAPLFLLDGGSEIHLPITGESMDATLDDELPGDERTGSEITIARIGSDPGTDEVTVARLGSDPGTDEVTVARLEPDEDPAEADPAPEEPPAHELQLEHLTLPSRRPRESRSPSFAPPVALVNRRRLALAGGSAVLIAGAVLASVLVSSREPAPEAAPAETTVESTPAETPPAPAPLPAPAAAASASVEPEPAPAVAGGDRPGATPDTAGDAEPDEDLLSVDDDPDPETRLREERRERRREARREERRKARAAAREAAAAAAAPAKTDAERDKAGAEPGGKLGEPGGTKAAPPDKPATDNKTAETGAAAPAKPKPDPAPAEPTPDWAVD